MKKIIPAIIIISVALAITAVMIISKKAPAIKAVEESIILVNTIEAKSTDVTLIIESQGMVQPRTETTLVTEVAGLVISVSDRFHVGGFLNAGDVLLTLDPLEYHVAVEQARADLLTAQAQLDREQAIGQQAHKEWDMTGRPREEAPILALRTPYLKEAKARVLYAEAELKRTQRKLDRTIIRAPYTGLIREKFVDIGQFVAMGTSIARTFAVDFAEVRLPVTNSDIEFLHLPLPGQDDIQQKPPYQSSPDVTLYATIGGNRYQWPGRIVRTEGVIDTNSRMHYAIAQITDPYRLNRRPLNASSPREIDLPQNPSKPPLTIGTFVNASLQGISLKSVFSVPNNILHDGNQLLIMDDDQRLQIRRGTILRRGRSNSWVKEGLFDKDKIITTTLEAPIEGMKLAYFEETL